MSLLPQPTAIAAEIDGIHRETISFLRAQARRSYDLANTAGMQQEVMNALGDKATAAVGVYAAIYQLLTTLGHNEGLSAPDLTVFQPQQDGTVLYVAPPPPPQPEPEQVEEPQP